MSLVFLISSVSVMSRTRYGALLFSARADDKKQKDIISKNDDNSKGLIAIRSDDGNDRECVKLLKMV